MKKRAVFCCLMLAVSLLLCACRNPAQGKKMPDAALTGMYFSERVSFVKPVQGYSLEEKNGEYLVSFDLSYQDEPLTVPADKAFAEKIKDILIRYKVQGWDGFDKTAKELLDGTQFSARFSFADGAIISAKGYGHTPENYRAVTDEIVALFETLLPEEIKNL